MTIPSKRPAGKRKINIPARLERKITRMISLPVAAGKAARNQNLPPFRPSLPVFLTVVGTPVLHLDGIGVAV